MSDWSIDETKSVSFNLRVLGKELFLSFDAYAEGKLLPEVAQGEYRIIGYVCHHPGASPMDLGNEFRLCKSTISGMVSSLKERGYLSVKTSRSDKRKIALYPTEKALAAEQKAKEVFQQFDEAMEKGISEEDRERLYSIFRKIESNMKEVKKP